MNITHPTARPLPSVPPAPVDTQTVNTHQVDTQAVAYTSQDLPNDPNSPDNLDKTDKPDKPNSSQPSDEPTLAQRFSPFKVNKFIVGLTGGIGSGKTAVSDWFAKQGISIVDADVVAHQIMQKGSPTLERLVEAFGDWVLDEEGGMDRQAVRKYVFINDEALLTLEEITHPAIRQQIKAQLLKATSPYVILSAPLLLESAEAGLISLCDRVLVVDASESVQMSRASRRDKQNTAQIKAVMANQLPREQRLSHADDVVENNGTLDELHQQLTGLHQRYLDMSHYKSNQNL